MKILYKFILFGFCVLWSFPIICDVFKISTPVIHLYGVTEYPNPFPEFKKEEFLDLSFQEKLENYVKYEIPYKEEVIRWTNQFNFSILKHISTDFIALGKDNYLFEKPYIEEYLGNNLISEKQAEIDFERYKQVVQILNSKGKKVLFVFAPGKPYFFPEKLYLKNPKNKLSNYDRYSAMIKNSGVDYIDLNSYFKSQKSSSQFPLYPQLGAHWSTYGAKISFDTIYKKMEQMLGRDIVDYYLITQQVTDSSRGIDFDLGSLTNLKFKIKEYPLAYPAHEFTTENKFMPNLFVIADSYLWNFYYLSFIQRIFNSQYAYYNHLLYGNDRNVSTNVDPSSYNRLVDNSDIILILETTANLSKFGFNFGTKMYYEYCKQGIIKDSTYNFSEPYPRPNLKSYTEKYLEKWLDQEVNGVKNRRGFEALWNDDQSFKDEFNQRWVAGYYDFMGEVGTDEAWKLVKEAGFEERNFATALIPHIIWWRNHVVN